MRLTVIALSLLLSSCGQGSVATTDTDQLAGEREPAAVPASEIVEVDEAGGPALSTPEYAGPGDAGFDDFDSAWSAPDPDGQPVSRYGMGLEKLPPPKTAGCWSEAAVNEAMVGSGCDCSCEGYARQPASQCQIACGLAYYQCWAPDPTEAEIRDQRAALFEAYDPQTRAALEAEFRQAMADDPQVEGAQRAALMLARATEWVDAQRCPAFSD